MKYLEEIKNAVGFFLDSIKHYEPKTVEDMVESVDDFNKYSEVKQYLNSLSEPQAGKPIDDERGLALQLLIQNAVRNNLFFIEATQLENKNFIGRVVSGKKDLILYTRVEEYLSHYDAIANLKSLLGIL
jgi:hypothetical protein